MGVLTRTTYISGSTILVATGIYTPNGMGSISITKDTNIIGGWNYSFTEQNGRSLIIGPENRIEIGVLVSATFTNLGLGGEYGAIFNYGGLKLKKSYVVASMASAIYNYGNLFMTDVLITESGNGITNFGIARINHSRISNNRYRGIINHGEMTVTETTISHHNEAFGGCNGIGNDGKITLISSAITQNGLIYDGPGGGMCNLGTAVLINSTVSYNRANDYYGQGGGLYNSGELFLYNTTVSHNSAIDGGGIYNYMTGTVWLYNS